MDKKSFSPSSVLVVDSLDSDLAVLTKMIQKAGYIARPVSSARQAVDEMEALLPDLILLDIFMPGIDGFAFCSMLKKNRITRDIPVILMTTPNSKEDRRKSFQLGAADYITKPFEAEEVMARINTHLKIYKMQQELEIYSKKLYRIINDQIRKIYEGQKNVAEALAKLYVESGRGRKADTLRIGNNCRILAISLQLSPKFKDEITNSFIDIIEKAALLHDIGALSADEETLCSHAELGARILKEVLKLNPDNDFIRMAADIACYHQERWDGTGYPAGKSGNEIPICARIVAIVEAYDKLISSGRAKESCSQEDILNKLRQGAGTLYDPDMITVLCKVQNQLRR
ncbi:putative two-component system response regulator [Anaerotaenia torta]|uniref:response regulator n=1 Tax=Anaerotaenia torta TaxID=433293 RepID=UPI003D1E0F89